ncbi:MAG: hypothetical protein N2380_00195 [bacterium]|nr:hypothetical protein [bacterium]
MDSRYDIVIWILSFAIVIAGVWGINNPEINVKININQYIPKEEHLMALDRIQVYPVSEKGMVMSILEKELPKTKLSLIKKIEIKDGEVYVILYNDVPCRLGTLVDLNRKLDLILKILSTTREKGIRLKEIDVRSLKFPTILEGESEDK